MKPTDNSRKTEPLVERVPEEAVLPALSQSAHPVEFIESNNPEEPLVEQVPEEAVLPALSQSAHPVEFIESNKPVGQDAESDES
jgi:Tfp pilus assembly protein PilN